MTVIARACPGWVRQTHENSCWAAVLEAWGRADPQGPQVQQADLIARWSTDPADGRIGGEELERLALSFSPPLQGRANRLSGQMSRSPIPMIRAHLPTSYVFCLYTDGAWTHAVLIYRLRDRDVSFMDPDGGRYLNKSHSWLSARAPHAILWR